MIQVLVQNRRRRGADASQCGATLASTSKGSSGVLLMADLCARRKYDSIYLGITPTSI